MITHLKAPDGTQVATAKFEFNNGYAAITIETTANGVLTPGFHDVHIHKVGKCEPNSAAPNGGAPGDFLSAGDHFQVPGHSGEPASGALPPLQVRKDGSGTMMTTTDAFAMEDLLTGQKTAIIIHAGAASSAPSGGTSAATRAASSAASRSASACSAASRSASSWARRAASASSAATRAASSAASRSASSAASRSASSCASRAASASSAAMRAASASAASGRSCSSPCLFLGLGDLDGHAGAVLSPSLGLSQPAGLVQPLGVQHPGTDLDGRALVVEPLLVVAPGRLLHGESQRSTTRRAGPTLRPRRTPAAR